MVWFVSIIKCPQGDLIIFQGLVYKIDKLIYCQVLIAHDCPGYVFLEGSFYPGRDVEYI